MEFKEMTKVEMSHIEDALQDMGIEYKVNYKNSTFTVYGETFTDQEEMDDHIIWYQETHK